MLEIITALVSVIGSFIGTLSGIIINSKLTNYRIEQLENKRFKVSFFAKEGGIDVLSLSLVVSSRAQAEQMVAQFEEHPDGFYRGVFFCATGKLEFLT